MYPWTTKEEIISRVRSKITEIYETSGSDPFSIMIRDRQVEALEDLILEIKSIGES